MKLISHSTYLDYSDVLIVPNSSSEVNSRKDVNVKTRYLFQYSDVVYNGVPVMAANMANIGTPQVNRVMNHYDMFTCFHKSYTDFGAYKQMLEDDKKFNNAMVHGNAAITIGVKETDIENIKKIFDSDLTRPKFICIDIANGHMTKLSRTVSRVREIVGKDAVIIAGNVVTSDAAMDLAHAGADVIKVGIGPGSVCTTRIKTGCGLPQFSAVDECVTALKPFGYHVIADGGCTSPGDVAKAFGVGASFVMLGGMLAGADETGTHFYGSSSERAMIEEKGKLESYRTSEGKGIIADEKGPLSNILDDIIGGVRSACSYVGVRQLSEMECYTQFAKVNHQYNTLYDNKVTHN